MHKNGKLDLSGTKRPSTPRMLQTGQEPVDRRCSEIRSLTPSRLPLQQQVIVTTTKPSLPLAPQKHHRPSSHSVTPRCDPTSASPAAGRSDTRSRSEHLRSASPSTMKQYLNDLARVCGIPKGSEELQQLQKQRGCCAPNTKRTLLTVVGGKRLEEKRKVDEARKAARDAIKWEDQQEELYSALRCDDMDEDPDQTLAIELPTTKPVANVNVVASRIPQASFHSISPMGFRQSLLTSSTEISSSNDGGPKALAALDSKQKRNNYSTVVGAKQQRHFDALLPSNIHAIVQKVKTARGGSNGFGDCAVLASTKVQSGEGVVSAQVPSLDFHCLTK